MGRLKLASCADNLPFSIIYVTIKFGKIRSFGRKEQTKDMTLAVLVYLNLCMHYNLICHIPYFFAYKTVFFPS